MLKYEPDGGSAIINEREQVELLLLYLSFSSLYPNDSDIYTKKKRGVSSVGRAQQWHC